MLKYLRLIFGIVPMLLLEWPRFVWYARHPERTPLEVRYRRIRRLVLRLIRLLHPDFHIEGRELFRRMLEGERSFLLVSDHVSLLDPVILIFLSERPLSFVAKKEVMSYPLVSPILRALGGLSLDREDLKGSVRVVLELRKGLEKDEAAWGIFPEGTRRKDLEGPVLPFHPGSFKAALSAKRDVLLLAMEGQERLLSFISWNRYPIGVRFLERMSMEDAAKEGKTTVEIAEHAVKVVQEGVARIHEENEDYVTRGLHKLPWRGGAKVR